MYDATTQTPRFCHDCTRCTFLGGFDAADLYFCCGSLETTVIARYSDEGSNYASGMAFSFGSNAHLTEARRRAQKVGVLEFPLREALAYAVSHGDASSAVGEELREHLSKHPLAGILASMRDAPEAGTAALQRWLVESANDPARDLTLGTQEDRIDWQRTVASHAYDWARRLELARPAHRDFIVALYADIANQPQA